MLMQNALCTFDCMKYLFEWCTLQRCINSVNPTAGLCFIFNTHIINAILILLKYCQSKFLREIYVFIKYH